MASIKDIRKLGQSIWLDFISRGLVTSGEFEELVNNGVSGLTSNPTIFQHAISTGAEYDEPIRDILRSEPDIGTKALYDRLIIEDIRMAADILRPVYEESGGIDGMVSLEPPAQLAYDADATMAEVRRLWHLADRPNVMIKIPATSPGIPAIEALTAEGININITLMFSMKHYDAVSHAYISGVARSRNPKQVVSVASFFVSRVDTLVDKELEKIGTEEALSLRGKAAIANSKLVYRRFRGVFFGSEFADARQRGVRIQRVLWGSTSTKNPVYSDVKYVEGLIGRDTINTVPLETLRYFQDHGKARETLTEGLEEAEQVMIDLKTVGIDMAAVTEELQRDGVKKFADSLDELLEVLERKRRQLQMSLV